MPLQYGRIRNIDIKPRGNSAFAFIEFDDDRDANEAVYRLDRFRFDGRPLRVELKKGGGPRDGGRERERSGRGGYDDGYGGERRDRDRAGGARATNAKAKRTPYTAKVSGLPQSASWQDVKDFVRPVARPAFAEVMRDGDGVVGEADFDTEEDLLAVIEKLNGTEFKNRFDAAQVSIERVRENYPAPAPPADEQAAPADTTAEDTRRRDDGDARDEEEEAEEAAAADAAAADTAAADAGEEAPADE